MTSGVGIPNYTALNLNANAGGFNRQTVNTNFAGKLRQAARATTLTAQRSANQAAPFIPGAAVLSATLGGAAASLSEDSTLASRTALGSDSINPAAERGDLIGAMEEMQQTMVSNNMQMLNVQRKFQQESEKFTLSSNIMKTRHDTSKNAINNVR